MGSAWFLYEALALLRSAGCYGQLLTRAASDSQRVGAGDICLRVLSDGFMHTQRYHLHMPSKGVVLDGMTSGTAGETPAGRQAGVGSPP